MTVWQWLTDWWGGVELWLVNLWFPLQFALFMAVLLPVSLGAAWLIDRVIDFASAWLTRVRDAEPPLTGEIPVIRIDETPAEREHAARS